MPSVVSGSGVVKGTHSILKYVWFLSALILVTVGCNTESADDLFTNGEYATHDVETYDEAVGHLTKFLDLFPDDPRADVALQAIARVYQAQGKSDKAITSYETLISRFPDSRYADQAQFMVGYIHDLNGKKDAAIKSYEALIARFPESSLADDARVSIKNIDKPLESWIGTQKSDQ